MGRMEGFGKEIEQIKNIIEANDYFLLVNHIRMDPDAFGSLAAFYLILKKLGKKVLATNDEKIPENFCFLSNKIDLQPLIDSSLLQKETIIFSFDAASLEQLGKTYENNKVFFEKNDFIVIDHHITNSGFGDINIIDTKASSTCEIVYTLIDRLGYKYLIDEEIATLLLAGIHTDTNTFYNKNTSANTLRVAAELLSLGARNKEIIFEFYRKKSLEKVHLWGKLMIKIQQDKGLTWISVKKDTYKDIKEKDQGFKGFINEVLANIEGTSVALFLYEEEDASIKVSLRSNRDEIDVAQICSKFGGGGHKLAAGFTSNESIEVLEKIIIAEIKKAL